MNTKDAIKIHITDKTALSSVLNTKVGQLITETLMHTRTGGNLLEIKCKGFNANDEPNTSFDLEPGDYVYGSPNANTYWISAMYMGGDPEDYENSYRALNEVDVTDLRADVIYN